MPEDGSRTRSDRESPRFLKVDTSENRQDSNASFCGGALRARSPLQIAAIRQAPGRTGVPNSRSGSLEIWKIDPSRLLRHIVFEGRDFPGGKGSPWSFSTRGFSPRGFLPHESGTHWAGGARAAPFSLRVRGARFLCAASDHSMFLLAGGGAQSCAVLCELGFLMACHAVRSFEH